MPDGVPDGQKRCQAAVDSSLCGAPDSAGAMRHPGRAFGRHFEWLDPDDRGRRRLQDLLPG